MRIALLLAVAYLAKAVAYLAKAAHAEERWVVITGASSGIGSAMAVEAGRRGYSVVLAARRRDKLQDVAAEARRAGSGSAVVVRCDLATAAGRRKLLSETRSRTISMAILNAGFAYGGEFIRQGRRSVEEMVALNVGSSAALAREYAEVMAIHGSGRILMTGSISAAPLGTYQNTYLSIYKHIHRYRYLPIYLYTYISVYLFIYLSIYQTLYLLSIYLYTRSGLYIYPMSYISIRLSISIQLAGLDR